MTKEMDEVRGLAHEHGTNLSFVVNHFGGKDSARMLGFVRKKSPDTPTDVVMVDTGFEHTSPNSAAD